MATEPKTSDATTPQAAKEALKPKKKGKRAPLIGILHYPERLVEEIKQAAELAGVPANEVKERVDDAALAATEGVAMKAAQEALDKRREEVNARLRALKGGE